MSAHECTTRHAALRHCQRRPIQTDIHFGPFIQTSGAAPICECKFSGCCTCGASSDQLIKCESKMASSSHRRHCTEKDTAAGAFFKANLKPFTAREREREGDSEAEDACTTTACGTHHVPRATQQRHCRRGRYAYQCSAESSLYDVSVRLVMVARPKKYATNFCASWPAVDD